MNPLPATDPYLSLPLHGVQLIEASAGTGKTFTLATLFTRLVVERQLRIGEILAVTFTEAATQELRKRIRERLMLAARLADGQRAPDAADEDDTETALTRAILARHQVASAEAPAALGQRLRTAADEIDLAAIFTIHGFCARTLREHALESGHTFDPPELLGSERELLGELAADLWRQYAADADTADALAGLWNSPDALAADLRDLLKPLPLQPAVMPLAEDPAPAVSAAAHRLSAAIDADMANARALIGDAFERKVFDGRRAKRPSFEKAFADLEAGNRRGQWPREGHLEKLVPAALRGFCREDQIGRVPQSPLFDALAAWCDADDRMQQWQSQHRVQLLHRLRDDARARLAHLKQLRRVQTYDDLIDCVAAALDGAHGPALTQRLRAQYRIALVDEFQDTDERQWSIFQRVFGDAPEPQGDFQPALLLIGDPKQAIYGFRGGDVRTYLKAKRQADLAPPLDRNFRSRPAVLSAIAGLYANAGDGAFVESGIVFEPAQPGDKRNDADFLRGGRPAPALTLRRIPDPAGQGFNAEVSRQQAAAACVADIHALLIEARDGHATVDGRPVQPGDIAVLVRRHHEATRIQHALAAVGIPAVAVGRQSLFATEEAHELRMLLLALLQPADDARLRAALATRLLGESAAAIAALAEAGDRLHAHQRHLLDWRERWQRSGPFALVSDLCAHHASRLLTLIDGERRLTNYLQLGELLQEASLRALGLHGLVDWLQLQIAHADADDEQQLLRLESDAHRVQIVTLHKSKGLEYPLVFLPFIGIGGKPGGSDRHCTVHEDDRRVLHWKIDRNEERWKIAAQRHAHEADAEEARLLYVGLTRARHALWIATGPFYQADRTALAPMLSDIGALAGRPGIVIDDAPPPAALPWLPPEAEGAVMPARHAQRRIDHDWWVYSFTQLSHSESGQDDTSASATLGAEGGNDEPAPLDADAEATDGAPETYDPRFAGNRFGVVLHEALERSDFAAWQPWSAGEPAPADQDGILAGALRAGGYPEADVRDGVALLTQLVGQTLTVRLPEGVRLCEVPAESRRAEIEFHFALRPTEVNELLQVLHAHGVAGERQGFGLRRRLEGLMTGKIDLTYQHDGRWYVLDYKSNRLPAYDAAQLALAMTHSEYDLQALIYTLALHRWLRFRLGDGYDQARDFGGIRYLFCRGLEAARPDSPGVHAQRFAPELVHALDALFAGEKPPPPRAGKGGGGGRPQAGSNPA